MQGRDDAWSCWSWMADRLPRIPVFERCRPLGAMGRPYYGLMSEVQRSCSKLRIGPRAGRKDAASRGRSSRRHVPYRRWAQWMKQHASRLVVETEEANVERLSVCERERIAELLAEGAPVCGCDRRCRVRVMRSSVRFLGFCDRSLGRNPTAHGRALLRAAQDASDAHEAGLASTRLRRPRASMWPESHSATGAANNKRTS